MGPSPAPSTGFSYLCWPSAQSGDEWVDQVLSFINPPWVDFSQNTSVVGSTQPPNAHMGAWCLPLHPGSLPCPGYRARKTPQMKAMKVCKVACLVGQVVWSLQGTKAGSRVSDAPKVMKQPLWKPLILGGECSCPVGCRAWGGKSHLHHPGLQTPILGFP